MRRCTQLPFRLINISMVYYAPHSQGLKVISISVHFDLDKVQPLIVVK